MRGHNRGASAAKREKCPGEEKGDPAGQKMARAKLRRKEERGRITRCERTTQQKNKLGAERSGREEVLFDYRKKTQSELWLRVQK